MIINSTMEKVGSYNGNKSGGRRMGRAVQSLKSCSAEQYHEPDRSLNNSWDHPLPSPHVPNPALSTKIKGGQAEGKSLDLVAVHKKLTIY